MAAKKWAFEDFDLGATIDIGSKLVTAEEIIEFASEFDPQPMHLDEAAGKRSILGGLAASGWHTCAMSMRLMCDAFLLDSTSQGSTAVDQVKWKKPVLAGDRLSGKSKVLAKQLSEEKPLTGFVTLHTELVNQRGESVFELENVGVFLTREAAES